MYKRSLSLVVVILLTLCIPLLAAADGFHVHDDASLLSDNEVAQLETLASQLSDELDCDIVILTVDSIGSKSVVAFADDYYDDNGYAENGILLMLSMQEREWYISTCGDLAYELSSRDEDALLEVGLDYFSDGKYYEGFDQVLRELPYHVTEASQERSEDLTGLDILLFMLPCAVIGAVVAGVVLLIMRSGMNTKHKQSGAAEYIKQGSYRLKLHRDMFLYSQITKTPRQTSSSGSSGNTHRSSSGRIHGGGGRKF